LMPRFGGPRPGKVGVGWGTASLQGTGTSEKVRRGTAFGSKKPVGAWRPHATLGGAAGEGPREGRGRRGGGAPAGSIGFFPREGVRGDVGVAAKEHHQGGLWLCVLVHGRCPRP